MGSRPDDLADQDRDQRAGTALPHPVVLTSCGQPMRQNLAVFDFALEPADEAAGISALGHGEFSRRRFREEWQLAAVPEAPGPDHHAPLLAGRCRSRRAARVGG